MIKKKAIPQWKIDEVNILVDLFKKYKSVAVIEVAKISDKQFQHIRKILRDKAELKMSKKNLQMRALEQYRMESNKTGLDYFANMLPGQASLVFTDMNIFELKEVFYKNKWMVPAKPNEVTPVDIYVPAGDTGLPTGQVISELNVTLKLPTRVQNDTIWVREDTQTHSAGDVVGVKEAAVLKKLGVHPIESLLKIKFAWSDGKIISADVIYLDLEAFKREFASYYFTAQSLAVKLGIIDKETIKPLIQKAYREALAVLFKLPIYVEGMRDEYIRKAVSAGNILNSIIFGGSIVATSTATSKTEDKSGKPKKEEKKEKEA